MIRTSSHIEAFVVNGGTPKSGNNQPVIVRAPTFMKCFRATIYVSKNATKYNVFISTVPTTNEEICIELSSQVATVTLVPPDINTSIVLPNKLVLDRRGVGYMFDELYLYSDDANVQILWEGVIE